MEVEKDKAAKTAHAHNNSKSGGRDTTKMAKRYFAIQRTLSAFIVLTALIAIYLLSDENGRKFTPPFFALSLVLFIVRGVIMPRAWGKRVYSILYGECDPFDFAAIFQCMLHERVSKRNVLTIKLDIARGLFYQGNFLQAYNLTKEVDVKKLSAQYCIIYYNLLLNGVIALGYDERLREIDAELLEYNGRHRAQLIIVRQLLIQYELKKAGNVAAYRTELEKSMSEANYEYQRVALHYRLAELDFAASEFSNARAHLDYTLMHGNKLFYVGEAKKLIVEIEKQELTLEAKALLFSLVKENLAGNSQ